MYFIVKVEFTDIDDKGKVKKLKEQYLVDSLTVTESEAKVVKYLSEEGETRDYQIVSSNESKILTVL